MLLLLFLSRLFFRTLAVIFLSEVFLWDVTWKWDRVDASLQGQGNKSEYSATGNLHQHHQQ